MHAFAKFAVAFAAVALIGVVASITSALPGSADDMQRKLEQQTRDALGIEASSWASVTMDGQKAILKGEAPSAKNRDAVIARVAAAQWRGGVLIGGVTAVDARGLTVAAPAPRADPYIFIVEREGDVLSFSGHAPDQKVRDQLYRLAADLFTGAEISGGLEIADGAPVGPDAWAAAAESLMRGLSHLRHGVAEADGATFSLTGEAEDEDHAEAARSLLTDLPAALSGETSITVKKAPVSIEEIISQSDDPLSEETVETEDQPAPEQAAPKPNACVIDLEQEISRYKIGFNSARADIDNRSRDHLRKVAASLSKCPAARLRITGHTDSSGNAARNRQLSGYRADAVRAFLVSVGAPADRLSARGVGSAQPLASNATPAGREKNRRIDIEVLTAN